MQKYFLSAIALAFSVGILSAFAEPTVTITSVKQRMPWNGLVDIRYTLAGLDPAIKYKLAFELKVDDAAGHSKSWVNSTDVSEGEHSIVWDAAATTNLGSYVVGSGTLTAALLSYHVAKDTGTTYQSGDYLILNLNDFSFVEMMSVTDGTIFNTDEYKTTKMAFRKVPGCCFYMMGTTDDSGANPGHLVTLTHDYWIAIFTMTEAQYALAVNGTSGSTSMIPRNDLNWTALRGDSNTYNWPSVKTVAPNSVIGKLRAKISGYQVDLPTEAQWECAARAGTRTQWYWGSDESQIGNYAIYTGNRATYGAPGKVGQRAPNAWGLYDALGNIWNWMLDGYSAQLPYGDDPQVANAASRVRRGGTWNDPARNFDDLVSRHGLNPSQNDTGYHGVRLVLMKE